MSLSGTRSGNGPGRNYLNHIEGSVPINPAWDTTAISLGGPTGWESARVSLRAKNCPWHLTLLNIVSGHVFDYVTKCDSWTHRECAEAKAADHLGHIREVFSMEERIWVAHADFDPALPGRLRQRRFARREAMPGSTECMWIRRPYFVFIFATADLRGTSQPAAGEWMTPRQAYGVARTVMWLPGVGDEEGRKAINYSKGWKRRRRPSSGVYKEIAIGLSPKDEVLVMLAYEYLGTGPPIPEMGGGWKRPPGVDQVTWIGALTAASEAMSLRSRD